MKKEGYIVMSPEELDRLGVLEKVISKQLTQAEAAKILQLSRRQIIRICKRYRSDGAQGLASKRRGQGSNNQLPEKTKQESLRLIKEHYHDFGPTFAHEKLTEQHDIRISVESLRKLMIKDAIWKGKKRKHVSVHPMRVRRSQYGELVQIDGSPHAWFEDRGPRCTLLVFVDDATGRIMQLYFEPEESSAGYMAAIRAYLPKHGRPLTFYSDRHGIFRVNIKDAKGGTGETQFSRALRELDIDLINAHSPQAKGRVERMNLTLQDRLVKELRMKGISDIESANQFTSEFIDSHNKRFASEPRSPIDAHRPTIPDSVNLDLILCQKHTRTISKNLQVRYNNKIYQIQTQGAPGYTMRNAKAQIHDNQGHVSIVYKNKTLPYKIFDPNQNPTPIVDSKHLNQHLDSKKENRVLVDLPWMKTATLISLTPPV